MFPNLVAGTYLTSEFNRRYRVLEIAGDVISLMTIDGSIVSFRLDSDAFYRQFPCLESVS